MQLDLVYYGHPALRSKGRPVDRIDAKIVKLAEDMIETMYANDGVGLAAHQVGLPLRLFVLDVLEAKDRPSGMTIDGKKVSLRRMMPLALLNPVIRTVGEPEPGMEGCLSIPGITAEVPRPPDVEVQALTIEGKEINFEATGLLARAIQHENDHLNGILFTDLLEPEQKAEILPELNLIASEMRPRLG